MTDRKNDIAVSQDQPGTWKDNINQTGVGVAVHICLVMEGEYRERVTKS